MKIICKQCNKKKGAEQFPWILRGNNSKPTLNSRTCRSCDNHNSKVLYRLKKENPKPLDSKCACCGKVTKLVCDHDHNTDEFRGWLCEPCNTGIGKLGDDLNGLRMAMAYLKRVEKRNSPHTLEVVHKIAA
jgi:hypothetical protein